MSEAQADTPKVPEKFWNKTFLLSFEGRVTRYDWWVRYFVPLLGLNVLFGIFDAALGTQFFGVILSLAMLWPGLAITAKRLHDRGRTGWLQALPLGLVILAIVLAFASGTLGAVLGVVAGIVSIWFIIEIGFLRGTRGKNDYGEDPLEGIEELDDLPPPPADA